MENLLILFKCWAELRSSLRPPLVLLILRHQKIIYVLANELWEAELDEV